MSARSDAIVVDASVALKWLRDEEDDAWARAMVGGDRPLIAPALLLTECSNILWRLARRGEIARDGACTCWTDCWRCR
ncbi:type II toxin-antitoxin system VapC family toxin [Siccirubricoccus phaeus]|uniref:type II toxin-antitoxin system VapC family toxin n=1 Tax=Siccirubricoccus phaeus TaxID=2595053 RepID=UPI0011F175C0|nr:type II toxin-antitoxin system VapC family toxin [Siccirubricoccus phaeus]